MRSLIVSAVFVLVGVMTVMSQDCPTSTQNYCNICNGRIHIACTTLTSDCPKYTQVSHVDFDEPTQDAIVHMTNDLRNSVANGSQTNPRLLPAARMSTVTWSCEFAKLARKNVEQCALKHDQCRNIDGFYFAGQNLAASGKSGGFYSPQAIARMANQMWFNEIQYVTQPDLDKFTSAKLNKIGHFTQLIWNNALEIGCAAMNYFDGTYYWTICACNYGVGNIINEPVYKSSPVAASECTTGTNPEFNGLCSVDEPFPHD